MKKVDFKFVLLEFAAWYVVGILINFIMMIPAGGGKIVIGAVFAVAAIEAIIFFILWLAWGSKLINKLERKTMENNDKGFALLENASIESDRELISVDVESGEIGYVYYQNPFQLVVVSAADITDIDTYLSKGPFNATNMVSVQFKYQGKRLRVNTYVNRSRRAGRSVNSDVVQEAIARAEAFADLLLQAQRNALAARGSQV